MAERILSLENINKQFPGVKALDDAHLDLNFGEVNALLGENGAGKSTLMKILNGIYQPDSGKIILKGEEVTIKNSRDALRLGISMIHQELSPIYDMTVADNIFLGHLPQSYGLVKRKDLYKKTSELFESLGMDSEQFSPKSKMRNLSVAQIQMVEIAKAVAYNSEIIVMDEPTSAISDKEVEILFSIIKTLRQKGVAIIYISHKMDEIFRIADRVTVMRDGKFIACKSVKELDNNSIITMMVGREIVDLFKRKESTLGYVKLELQKVTVQGCFENVSFQVHKGEIIGLTGLVGSKRTEIAEAIFGLRKISSGSILIDGHRLQVKNTRDAIRHKIALVTEDRKRHGLFLSLPISFNISITSLQFINRIGFIKKVKEKILAERAVKTMMVKTPNIKVNIESLSGGNQQKVVLAKWLELNPDILILDEPTRGIDVGAKQEIYNIIDNLARNGKAIIVISSEMPEIMALSDRIVVMSNGKLAATLEKDEICQEAIMKYAVQF